MALQGHLEREYVGRGGVYADRAAHTTMDCLQLGGFRCLNDRSDNGLWHAAEIVSTSHVVSLGRILTRWGQQE